MVRHIPWLDVGLLTVPFERLSQLYLLSWENHAGGVLRCWTCWPERLRYRRADALYAGNFLLVRRLYSSSLVARFARSGRAGNSLLHSSCFIQLRPMQNLIKVGYAAAQGGQASIATGCHSIYDLSKSGVELVKEMPQLWSACKV